MSTQSVDWMVGHCSEQKIALLMNFRRHMQIANSNAFFQVTEGRVGGGGRDGGREKASRVATAPKIGEIDETK